MIPPLPGNQPPHGPQAEQAPGRLPLMMSAFGLPGAGQFMQHRWIAAALFGGGFLFTAAVFFVYAIRIIAAFYSLGLDFNANRKPDLPLRATAVYFAASLVIYIAGVIDTWIAYRRACSEWARRKARLPELPEG